MKKITLLLAFALISGAGFAQKIKGSDTMLPLSQKAAEAFMKANPTAKVTITGGGSGVGLSALIDGSTDIAMASRAMKMDEKLKMQEAGRAYKEVIVGYDALSVIVNPGNKVTQLTREQLEGIFTGKIKNWKEVGGDDMAIVVYSRESSSGTYEFFKEHVMARKNYAPTVLSMASTGAVVQSVGQTKGAIGYIGMAYDNASTKAIKVSFDKGKTFIAPSMETAKNKTYPITRPLYYYYLTAKEKLVKPYIDFMLSAAGQAVVKQTGYVPLN